MRTKQQTRTMLGLVVATTVVATLGACSAQTAGSDDVTLTFLHTANPDPTWAKAIAAFEKKHPGVTIKEQQTSFDDLNSQVQARLGTKDPSIDVYTVDGPRLASMAAQGFLTDVSADKSDIKAQTGQGSVDEVTYDGKQFAFPQWTSTNLMFYNKDLVAKAGLTLRAPIGDGVVEERPVVCSRRGLEGAPVGEDRDVRELGERAVRALVMEPGKGVVDVLPSHSWVVQHRVDGLRAHDLRPGIDRGLEGGSGRRRGDQHGEGTRRGERRDDP